MVRRSPLCDSPPAGPGNGPRICWCFGAAVRLLFEADVWLQAGGALAAFCLISSAIYRLNECLVVRADRAHPSKQQRPIAAGRVSLPVALSTAALLTVASQSLATLVTPPPCRALIM